MFLVLYTNCKGPQFLDYEEEDFFDFFTLHERGGHIGRVTRTVEHIIVSLTPEISI